MTAAALPLLTAGTLLSRTDAANAATQNNDQNGTTLNASVSASGAPGRQQFGGVGDRTRIIEPPEVLALSPERGSAPDRCGGS